MGWMLQNQLGLRLDRGHSLPAILVLLFGSIPSFSIAQGLDGLTERGVYRSPRIDEIKTGESEESLQPSRKIRQINTAVKPAGETADSVAGKPSRLADFVRQQLPDDSSENLQQSWVEEVVLKDPRETYIKEQQKQLSVNAPEPRRGPGLQQVGHNELVLQPPTPPADVESDNVARIPGKLAAFSGSVEASPIGHHDAMCDGCDQCDDAGCDSIGCGVFGCGSCDSSCDTLGCDSMGCCGKPWYRSWANGSLSLDRDRWFGGVDYLMMWQRGNRLPPLVTSDNSLEPDPDTAGRLDQGTTVILVGQDRIMERLGSGVRLTLGTWLDDRECLSLVGRGWFAGHKNYTYSQNQDQTDVLARPFLNVSDDLSAAEPDSFIVAFPDRASGAIHVSAESEAFGADVSIRQYLYGDLGVNLDFLYGYQYMRLNEGLGISSTSTSLSEDYAPLGSTISLADHFDVSNEFHGGQIGLATTYRERCWSFNCLAKVGFGSLRRKATRNGVNIRTNDGDTSINNTGLLVTSTNSGTVSDRTFGWIPELDLSLGWQACSGWDLTFGYHIVAMTDALQASGAIDPNLAVNLSEPPLGDQNPSAALRYRTFYMQGIHFGLQHVY